MLSRFRSRNANRNYDDEEPPPTNKKSTTRVLGRLMRKRDRGDDQGEPPPTVEKGSNMLFRFGSRNRNQDDGLGELPPTSKKGAVKMFGKLMGQAAKKAPGASESERHAVEQLGQVISEAATDYPEEAIPLPKKKKGGLIDRVDRLIVRVIAPQMKRQHEQYSDHDDRHSDNQSYDQHSDHDHDNRQDDRSFEYQPSIHEYSAHELGENEVAEHEHYSNHPPLVTRDQSVTQRYPRNPGQGQSQGYAATRSIDQGPAQYQPRNPSQGQSRGYADTRSIDQGPAQYQPRNPSQGHSRGHASVRPSNTKRTATSFSEKPSGSHVEPVAKGLKRFFPIHEPPISPIQIFCDEDSRGVGSKCRHPTFLYSRCTGKKKAVCVGINYIGQKRELHGCIDDAHDISQFLIRKYNYKPENVLVLTDDLHDERQRPTRANMINAMQWLVKDAKRHDSLFFHYSGHGGQTNGTDVDPDKGYDDVIFPVDYQRAGYIADRELNNYLVHPLPQGCRLTSLFDSCHSGTVLDLPYIYHSNGRLAGRNINAHWRASKASSADAISWCACKDDQSSADTQEHGEAVGAMSWAFRTALTRNPNQSYAQLLKSVREILRNRYSQVSQLSSSHPMDPNVRFLM